MTDDLLAAVLVFLHEVVRAGESDLVDILAHFLRRHADAVIGKGQNAVLLIYAHGDARLIIVRNLPHHAALGHRIAAVGNQLSYKNIPIGIQPFLDDGQKVFRMNG